MHVFWWVNSKYKRYTSSNQRLGSAGKQVRLNKEHWKYIFLMFRVLGFWVISRRSAIYPLCFSPIYILLLLLLENVLLC